jgi:hypothetical protein
MAEVSEVRTDIQQRTPIAAYGTLYGVESVLAPVDTRNILKIRVDRVLIQPIGV